MEKSFEALVASAETQQSLKPAQAVVSKSLNGDLGGRWEFSKRLS